MDALPPSALPRPSSQRPLIFISWSGEEERAIAQAIQSYLQSAQHVRTFVSATDIHSNHESWRKTVETALQEAEYGIICMTKRNCTAPWLMYESGALEMKLHFQNVSVLLLDMEESELPTPLNHKHVRRFDKKGFDAMVADIHTALHLPEPAFSNNEWNKLRNKVKAHLKRIPTSGEKEGNELPPPAAPVPATPESLPSPQEAAVPPGERKATSGSDFFNFADALDMRVCMRVTAPDGLFFDGNLLSNGDYFRAHQWRANSIQALGKAKPVSPDMPVNVGIRKNFNIGFDTYTAHTVATFSLKAALSQKERGNVRILPPDYVCFATLPPSGTYGYVQYEFMPRERAKELERQGRGRINH